MGHLLFIECFEDCRPHKACQAASAHYNQRNNRRCSSALPGGTIIAIALERVDRQRAGY